MSTSAPPSAGSAAAHPGTRTGNSAQLGSLLAVAAGVMFVATLAGAYVSVRNWIGVGSGGFIPETLKFDNYAGFMTMVSSLGAALAAEFALAGARLRNRVHATTGYALSVLLLLGAINAVWFIGQRSGLAADGTSYAILFYALLFTVGLLLVVGVIAAVVSAVRVLGGHVGGDDLLYGRAGNWLIHLAAAAATVGFFLIYTYK